MDLEEQDEDLIVRCCIDCKEPDNDGDFREADGDFYCVGCFSDTFTLCDNCQGYDYSSDVNWVYDEVVCDKCLNNNYTRCERCRDYCMNDNMHTIYDENITYEWCYSCYENASYYCEDCEESHSSRECWRSHLIRSYSYKPCSLFRWVNYDNTVSESSSEFDANRVRGSQTFMGFEVEVEANGGSLIEGSKKFEELDKREHLYLKNDGSLNHGFEVVSHPMTLDVFHRNSDMLFKPFEELSDLGFAAWRTTTCGMHVHVSRMAFVNKAHLWRFAWMFNTNPHNFKIFAGRDSGQWASFEGQKRAASKIIAGKSNGYVERYTAVNLSNPYTVEIRIFRSSLLPRRIMANLGMVDCVVEFTRNMSVKDVTEHRDSWQDFVNFILAQTDDKYWAVQYYVRKYFKELVLDNQTEFVDSDN